MEPALDNDFYLEPPFLRTTLFLSTCSIGQQRTTQVFIYFFFFSERLLKSTKAK